MKATLACAISLRVILVQKLIHHAIISNGNVSKNDSNFMRNLNCNPLTLSCSIKGQKRQQWALVVLLNNLFFLIWFISIQLWIAWTTTVSRQQRKSPVDLKLKNISHSSFQSSASHTCHRHHHYCPSFCFKWNISWKKKNTLLIWHMMEQKLKARMGFF